MVVIKLEFILPAFSKRDLGDIITKNIHIITYFKPYNKFYN